MRPHWWLPVLLLLALPGAIVPVQAQEQPNNILVVDTQKPEPPPDLLSEEEVDRLDRLQNEAVFSLPISPVSPDDRTVLVTSGEELAFLSLDDGSTSVINPESLGNYSPLPLAGFSSFSWLDERTIGALAVDFAAEEQANAIVKLRIDRETLAINAEPVPLPENTGIVSVAPNLDFFLLVMLPPSEQDNGEAVGRPIQVPVTRNAPGVARAERIPLPPALQRRVDRALASPAMSRVWMLQEGAESETIQATPTTLDLVLYARGGSELRYVTTIPEASVAFGSVWTRDSSHLAASFYGLADPERSRPFYDGALLSEEVYRDATGNLPPSINPILQNNNTYVVDFASGATQVLRPGGDNPPLLSAASWSTDHRTLLVKAWHPARLKGRTYPIYTPQFTERSSYRFYDRDLNEVGRLESDLFSGAAFASAVAEFVSPDEIIFRAVKGSDRHPYYYNRVSGELRNMADRAGSYYNVYATNQSRQVVFMYNSYTEPPDIYRMGWDGRGLVRLTWLNEELRLFANLRQDPVRFTLRNGQVRVGVLIQPADAPFPPQDGRVVVWQQGGPGVAMINRWLANVEDPYALLPGMGVPLLITPLAGRPGYSAATFNALADGGNYGQIDIDEQAEIVRQMIQRGWTSPGKVGITGCSYGGYFVLQSLVRYPDLYAAGNPQCGLVDMITEWTRNYDRLTPYLEGLPPYNNLAEYRRDSPAYSANAITAAVLTFHGSEDFLPIVQNENLHLQLVNRGVPARMVKFVGEGHGLADPANQLYAAQEQLAWFRQHLDE
ncbi:MAG: prolyl oligopeptidase family serine peptidase [Chloroflexi bacterium OHK40]